MKSIDQALAEFAAKGAPVNKRDAQRIAIAASKDKTSASHLLSDLIRRGFVEHSYRLTESGSLRASRRAGK